LNAIFNLPVYARVSLIAVVLLSLWLLLDNNDDAPPPKRIESHRSSDYAMTDFTLTIMDENGIPARTIQGSEMSHFPTDDSTEIHNPVAEFIDPDADNWEIRSDHGHTKGKGELILLTGNVIITNKDKPEIKLLTEKLNLDTEQSTAYTDEAVTIHSPQGETQSIGLHAALKDETINLHSRVRGQYNAAAN